MTTSKHKTSPLPPEVSSVAVEALKLLFLGLIFVIAAGSILWVNEWNNLTRQEKQLQDETALIAVDPTADIDSLNNGRLIHLSGTLKTDQKLRDDWLNFEIEGLRLFRRVQVFEKQEHGKLESYKGPGQWVDHASVEVPAIPNMSQAIEVTTQMWHSPEAKVGQYHIPVSLIEKLTLYKKVNLEDLLGLSGEVLETETLETSQDDVDTEPDSNASRWYVYHNRLYWGNLNRVAQVGDLRVDYYALPNELEVSLISRQAEPNLVEPYITKEGFVIERIQAGKHSWEELYPEGKPPLNWLVWTFRVLGWLLMWLGCWLIFLPARKFLKQLEALNLLQGFSPGRMSILGATLLSALVMSGAWVYYQPVWATTLLVCVLLIILAVGFFYWRKLQIAKNGIFRLDEN